MDPAKIEKLIGITLIILGVAALLFTLQFTLNVSIPSFITLIVFLLLFLMSVLTGISVLRGSGE